MANKPNQLSSAKQNEHSAQSFSSFNVEVWNSCENPEEFVASTADLEREWKSRQIRFHSLGYRDGIEAGKNSSVQAGFETGFSEAVDAGFRCGLTRGWTSAFTALPEMVQKMLLDDAARLKVGQSHEVLSSISSDKALHLFHESMNKRELHSLKAETVLTTSGDSLAIEEDSSKASTLVACLPSSSEVEKEHADVQLALKSAGIIL